MSLDDSQPPSLMEMKGRLETLQGAWMLASTPAHRAEINEDFKMLAELVKQRYGVEGKMVVDEIVAKHLSLQRPRRR